MLAFTSPAVQSSLVVKSAATIRPADRLVVGREASLIIPRLYLANLFTAQDEKQLTELGITHVVSVLSEVPKLPQSMPQLKTLHIPIEDAMNENILQYLDQTTEFIKSALTENEQNKVLVHCLVGMSRSTTVVCAYLVATTSMNALEAIGFVASKRCIAAPNIGFRQQLQKYSDRYHPRPPRIPSRIGKVSGEIVERLRWWKTRSVTSTVVKEETHDTRTVVTR